MKSLFWGWSGRINRKKYFQATMGLVAAQYVALLLMAAAGYDDSKIVAACIMGALIFFASALVVKRLHDLGKSAPWALLGLIPLINLYLGILLLVRKGSDGPNKFGPDPLQSPDTKASVQIAG